MSILQIAQWNYDRNGLEYKEELEQAMIAEEVNEFKDALICYLHNPIDKLSAIVNMVDAYMDTSFVYYGTLIKQLGNAKLSDKNFDLSIMNTIMTEILITHKVKLYCADEGDTIGLCLDYVMKANEKKPKTKAKGKVKKGSDWIDPKEQIKELLIDRGYQEYPDYVNEIIEGEVI